MSRVPAPTRPEPGARGAAADLVTSLTDLLLRWRYEGTVGAERVVRRVADRYGVPVDVAFLPDAAVLTVDGRTVVRSATPSVPPLNQVSVPVGTFVAAAAMTVAALRLGARPGRPPPYVLYLGAFYVLTPGSHGLRGIESWIGGRPVDAIGSVASMLGLLAAIAGGMLVGAALARRPPGAGR